MKSFNKILGIIITLSLLSCSQRESVCLSPFTEQIVDMFISTHMCEPGNTIVLTASRINNQMAQLHIDAPPAECPSYGRYCGTVFRKHHKIELWGESIDDFFWQATESPRLIEEDATVIPIIYDPCDWHICIDMLDTTIVPSLCNFSCGFPLSLDTLSEVLYSTRDAYKTFTKSLK